MAPSIGQPIARGYRLIFSRVVTIAAIIDPMLSAFRRARDLVARVLDQSPNRRREALTFGLFLHERRLSRRRRIDYLGSALMFGGGALMLAPVQGGNSSGLAMIAALAASGVVALLTLAAHGRRAAERYCR